MNKTRSSETTGKKVKSNTSTTMVVINGRTLAEKSLKEKNTEFIHMMHKSEFLRRRFKKKRFFCISHFCIQDSPFFGIAITQLKTFFPASKTSVLQFLLSSQFLTRTFSCIIYIKKEIPLSVCHICSSRITLNYI